MQAKINYFNPHFAIEYKKDPNKRQRLWLNLPSEEHPILDKAIRLSIKFLPQLPLPPQSLLMLSPQMLTIPIF
jgi:hypothetical protein